MRRALICVALVLAIVGCGDEPLKVQVVGGECPPPVSEPQRMEGGHG